MKAGALLRALPMLGALLLCAEQAFALTLRTEVSPRTAHVGEEITVKVTAVVGEDDESPQNPELPVRGAAETYGPSLGSQRRVSIHNFSMVSEESITATWSVVPTATGKITIGPPSFTVAGKKVSGEGAVIEVVDGPAPPRGRSRQRLFDPWGSDPFGWGSQNFPRAPALPEAPPELALDKAPDPISFLHVTTSKKKVVVGEPVLFTVYAYGSRGPFREVSPNEPSTADFLSFNVVESSHDEPTYRTTIAGEEWQVMKLREILLVPLKAGALPIGSMSTYLQGRSYPAGNNRFGRAVQSPALTLDVVEPPTAGRPDGYLIGDVGRFELSAEVSPRELVAGDYAEVLVKIRGRGNLPSRVLLPSGSGLEWQEPRVSGGPAVKNKQLQGTRTLKFAVRAIEPGELALGAVRLPFYDPSAGRYAEARAELGSLQVKPAPRSVVPGARAPAAAAAAPEEQSRDPALRTSLRPFELQSDKSAPSWFPLLLFGAPASVGLLRWLTPLWARWSQKRQAKAKAAPPWKETLREARRAARSGRSDETLRALERCLYGGIAEVTGVGARALVPVELEAALASRGASAGTAAEIARLTRELEAQRYGATGSGLSTIPDEIERVLEALRRETQSQKKGAA